MSKVVESSKDESYRPPHFRQESNLYGRLAWIQQ